MLHLERRHTKKCNEEAVKALAKEQQPETTLRKKAPNANQALRYPDGRLQPKELKKCLCPIWLFGTDSRGKFHRDSLDTTDITVASTRMQKIELGEPIKKPLPSHTIEAAWRMYTGILQSQRGVKDSSIHHNYEITFNGLIRQANADNRKMLADLDGDETFCDNLILKQWGHCVTETRHGHIQRVQDFFAIAHSRGWIDKNPSTKLQRPKRIRSKKTLPFDLETEDPKIVEAIPRWPEGIKRRVNLSVWGENPETAAALMYVLRFTGVRISDAIKFEPDNLKKRVVNGKDAYVYFLPEQQKTGEPVFIIIRPDVGEYIVNAPRLTKQYAFYDPEGTENEGVKKRLEHFRQWEARFRQNVLRYVQDLSGVPNIHPHRFRDTFAVHFLQEHGDIRALSRLLGHKQVATTLEYYEHYIPSDQQKAVEAMMKTWQKEKPINVISFPEKKQA